MHDHLQRVHESCSAYMGSSSSETSQDRRFAFDRSPRKQSSQTEATFGDSGHFHPHLPIQVPRSSAASWAPWEQSLRSTTQTSPRSLSTRDMTTTLRRHDYVAFY